VDVPEEQKPAFTLAFHGAWPNPMTEQTRIVFDLARRGPVSVNLFDLRGRLVSTILDATLEPGPHSVAWDGRSSSGARLGAGIYWMRFGAEGREFVKRVVVLN
jgi:flagellar hook assembly protein FlgD